MNCAFNLEGVGRREHLRAISALSGTEDVCLGVRLKTGLVGEGFPALVARKVLVDLVHALAATVMLPIAPRAVFSAVLAHRRLVLVD